MQCLGDGGNWPKDSKSYMMDVEEEDKGEKLAAA